MSKPPNEGPDLHTLLSLFGAADEVVALGYAFRAARALMSAVELDLFTVLAEEPRPAGRLARLSVAGGSPCTSGDGAGSPASPPGRTLPSGPTITNPGLLQSMRRMPMSWWRMRGSMSSTSDSKSTSAPVRNAQSR